MRAPWKCYLHSGLVAELVTWIIMWRNITQYCSYSEGVLVAGKDKWYGLWGMKMGVLMRSLSTTVYFAVHWYILQQVLHKLSLDWPLCKVLRDLINTPLTQQINIYERSMCRYVRLEALNVLNVHGPCFNAPQNTLTKLGFTGSPSCIFFNRRKKYCTTALRFI